MSLHVYIFDILYLSPYMPVLRFILPLRLGWLLVLRLKASVHSLKRFTSRPFLKLSFSPYAPVTSDEYHAWFHLNTASPALTALRGTRNKKLVHGRIQTHNTARPLDYKSTVFTTRPIIQRNEWRKLNLNVIRVYVYIYTIDK